MWMKKLSTMGLHLGGYVLGAGLIGILYTMAAWWTDVVKEAEHGGYHTRVVQISHRYGMILFIASEVMSLLRGFGRSLMQAYLQAKLTNMPALNSQVAFGRPRAFTFSIPSICLCSIHCCCSHPAPQ